MQAALTIVLVVVAATLLASVRAVQSEPLGFDQEALLVGTLELLDRDNPSLPRHGPDGMPGSLSRGALLALRDSVRTLPGVAGVSIATGVPAKRLHSMFVSRRGAPDDPRGPVQSAAILNIVDDEFFATAGLRLRRGRAFTRSDYDNPLSVAIISSTLSFALWGDADPIGECLMASSIQDAIGCTIVIGVVDDAKYLSIVEPPQPTLYLPLGPNTPLPNAAVYIRRHRGGTVSAGQVLRLMRASDARPIRTALETFASIVAPQAARFRLAAAAATLLSAAGLVMLTAGLAAHLRVVFAARRREIGVRLALGARAIDIGRFVARDLFLGMAVGAGVGALFAYGAVRYVQPLLYGVTSLTVWAYALGLAAVTSVALVSVGWPAIRATRVPPLETLR